MRIKANLGFIHQFVPTVGEARSQTTLLMLHGTGGDENDLLDLGRAISSSAAFVSPRGQVLENGAPRFFRRLAQGVFDLPDLHRRTSELADFIQAAAATYNLRPDRIVAVGFSNGANIAASLLLSGINVLAGAILLRPMVPFEPESLPKLERTPVLISAGSNDPIVPASNTNRLTELLREAGASVTLKIQNAGHGLTTADVETARTWFAGFEGKLHVSAARLSHK